MTNKTLAGLLAGALSEDSETAKRRAVWDKGTLILGFDAAVWRRDDEGSVICYSDYGQYTEYGWEIDHQVPTALGGLDVYANMRPLHWRSNRRHGGLLGSILSGRRP
jgi:hypothetical protein